MEYGYLMAKLDLEYLEDLLRVCAGNDLAMIEAGSGEDHIKLVFHQSFPEAPEMEVQADTSKAPVDTASYAAQLLGDDTPKFNRED